MPNEQPLSSCASSSYSHSRSTFRPALSWQLCLRAFLFVIALAFASFDLIAEVKMASTTNGIPQSGETLIREANAAVSYFPFDIRLREYRGWVRSEVARREAEDAASISSTAPMGMGK